MAVHSLLQWHPDCELAIHLLVPSSDIARDEVIGIEEIVCRYEKQFKVYAVDISRVANVAMEERFSSAVLLRLLAPTYVKCPRCIYLDSDLVVTDRLDSLLSFDLDGHIIGAPMELSYAFEDVLQRLGLCEYFDSLGIHAVKGRYFNSGVLVIDVEKWNEADTTNRLLKALGEIEQVLRHGDQDVLNLVLQECWRELPVRYNCAQNIWRLVETSHGEGVNEICLARKAQLEEAKKSPAIVHYVGRKPWDPDYFEFAEPFPKTLAWRRVAKKIAMARVHVHPWYVVLDWRIRHWTKGCRGVRWCYFGIRRRVVETFRALWAG